MINLKSRVIVINNKKTKIILLVAIIFIAMFFALVNLNKDNENMHINQSNLITEQCSNVNEKCNKEETNSNLESRNYKQNEVDFPKEIEGVEVIGKLEIPKINLTTYILAETSKENLNKSVTRLCGPKANGVGNICITGHNYYKDNMFGDLKKLEKGDRFYITDMKGNVLEYEVYDIYKVYPKETECLSQETGGERQVTLITCTTGAIKRLIVKAVEIYD